MLHNQRRTTSGHRGSMYLHMWQVSFLVLMVCGLSTTAWAKEQSVAVVPFVSTQGGSQSSFHEASTKLLKKLQAKQVKALSASQKGGGSQPVKLPFANSYKRGMSQFRQGKALLRKKKAEAARSKLEAAIKNLEKGLAHLRDFGELIEIYRLLGICYFRMGMSDEGEEIIRRLGALVPRYKFAVSKMPPAMRRVLVRAQKRAAKSNYTLALTVPAGSSIQLNNTKMDSAGGNTPIKKLAAGRHYLWVRKKGHLPYAKLITVKRGTTKLAIELKPLPKGSGPDFTSEVASIQARLKLRNLTRSVGTWSHKIAEGLSVDTVLMGYFHKSNGANELHMFLYSKSAQVLKKYPMVKFDLELLEMDIKLVTMSSELKAKLSAVGGLPTQPWMQKVAPRPVPVRRAAPDTRVVPKIVAVRPPARRPASTGGGDDDDDDTDTSIGSAPPPRTVARPVPRPAPRVEPRPAPRVEPRPTPRPAPRPATGGGDDDDDDTDTSISRTPPPRPVVRPAPRPAPRVEPRPAPRITPRPAPRSSILGIKTMPDSLKKDQAALARAKRSGKRVARLSRRRRTRRQGSFDPDRDVDWSNPLPQVNERSTFESRLRASTPAPAPAPVRVAPPVRRPSPTPPPPRRTTGGFGDDDDDPPPARTPVRRPPPRQRIEPFPRSSGGWGTDDRRRPPPPKPKKGKSIAGQWWFWTAIGAGAVVAGTVVGIAVAQSQPASSFDVHVTPNPPSQ